jgi:hypothetical protein
MDRCRLECVFIPIYACLRHLISVFIANNLMSIVNMIYLSTLTDSVPILPPFMPLHIGQDAPAVPFGEVFDIPRLASVMGRPLLEWHQIKDRKSTELEPLGCWSVWDSVTKHGPRPSSAPDRLFLGEQLYCPLPDSKD